MDFDFRLGIVIRSNNPSGMVLGTDKWVELMRRLVSPSASPDGGDDDDGDEQEEKKNLISEFVWREKKIQSGSVK